MKILASYLRQLADWLDPPTAWTVRITCDTSQAVASLSDLQNAFQNMLDKLEWGVRKA
jgi:hypothetical protein